MRLFVGWPLPEEVKTSIGTISRELQALVPRASWTRPGTYHLTFAFPGDQPDETIRALESALSDSLARTQPGRVRLGRPGFFPSDQRPRVGWLGLEPEEPLQEIAGAVRRALHRAEVHFDEKPFHPHLTVARMKSRWRRRDVERFLDSWDRLRGIPLLVDSVTLFESRLGAGGATHIERVRIELT